MNSKHRPEELASYCPPECSLPCSYTSLSSSSHPRSPLLTFSVPVLACALLPADIFPALTASCRHGMVPKSPCTPPACLSTAGKEILTASPTKGLDSSRLTQDSSEAEQPAAPSPAGTVAVCGHGWHGTRSVCVSAHVTAFERQALSWAWWGPSL